MKILSQKRNKNQMVLEIEAADSLYAAAQEQALVKAGRQIKIPGFRPGKAPKGMVAQVIDQTGLDVQAAQDLIADLYPQVIKEAKIDPVDYPKVEIVQQEKTKPFIFKLTIDVYPEVKLGKYKGLKAEKQTIEVTEEDVIKVLGNLQERIAPGAQKMALDDGFAKKVSQFGTLAELKAELRQTMQRERAAQAEAEVRNALVAQAAQDARVDLPNGLIEQEINIMLDELKTSLAQSNLTLEDYLKGIKKEATALREELRKAAEIRAKGKVVLKEIAKAEKLTISPAELETEINRIAAETAQPAAQLKARMEQGLKEHLEDYLLRGKALDFIIAKAKI